MSDPRGIMNVPKVDASVQAAARLEALRERQREDEEQPDKKKRKKKKINLDQPPEDGNPHVDLLA